MVESRPDKQIGYLLRSYPRLTQTFILNEIRALEQIGVSIRIFAMTDPHEKFVQSKVGLIQAPVHYLDEPLRLLSLGRLLRANAVVARRHFRGYLSSVLYIALQKDIDQGYHAGSRWACLLQAVNLVYLLVILERQTGRKIDHLHAHFAHDPALVACLAHRVAGIPFSFTAHARDLYQVSEKMLADRIRAASAVVTCCRANLEYLDRIIPSQRSKFSLVYHGVDLHEFRPLAVPASAPQPGSPLILSVGRLVEKKGFQDLLQALLEVKRRGVAFRCEIYGDGPLRQQLQSWIDAHGLAAEVCLQGDRPQQDLIPAYQNASLFILTPVQAADGDRDGIPNVLLESMAAGLPVITTAVAGIPELVEDNRDGLLFQPHDVQGIAGGIVQLLASEEWRSRLGAAAAGKVREHFDLSISAGRLKVLFTGSEPGRAGMQPVHR